MPESTIVTVLRRLLDKELHADFDKLVNQRPVPHRAWMTPGSARVPRVDESGEPGFDQADLEVADPVEQAKRRIQDLLQQPIRRATKEEAEILVMLYLIITEGRDKTEKPVTQRELAKKLGCSTGLIAKTEAWKAEMANRRSGRPASSPSVVTLSDKMLEIGIGSDAREEDSALERLVAEQEADYDPSPLDDQETTKPPREYKRL
ncbi:hypothetical protein OAJ60_01420 [Planctomycetaceae bacterium]|nr:hypothetical protein [Planctomycetaceae bacterium]